MSKLTILAHKNTLAGTRDGGRGPEYAPPAPGHPLTTGSIWDHDALCCSVADYRASRTREDYLALRLAASRCGLPDGEPPLAWAERRVSAYRNLMGAA
jgi:hypothetical protein